jgi:glutamine synthetase
MTEGRHLGGRGADGALEEPAKWLIAGLTRLAGALMAFGNCRRESFIRLRQAMEAPNTVFWGDSDRKALIRLPMLATAPGGRLVGRPTVEFRLPDGSAHPQLLLAGIAQALIHGKAQPDLDALLERTGAARNGDDAEALMRVPRSFAEVAKALMENREALEAGAVFPAGMIEQFAATLGA